MKDEADIKLKIFFNDPDLTSDECDEQARQLMAELGDMAEVEAVSCVSDPSPPQGSKAIGGSLAGWLTAQIKLNHVQQLFGWLGERLGGKLIEMEVEANGRKLKLKVHSPDELREL